MVSLGRMGMPICLVCFFLVLPLSANLNFRLANPKELFNLCHAQARNVIERIFGVVKHCIKILVVPAEYSMHIQAHILAALMAVHNFIREHDPNEINEYRRNPIHDLQCGHQSEQPSDRQLSDGQLDQDSHMQAEARRDSIAEAMWIQYQEILQEHGGGYMELLEGHLL
jgi:hypothetical protein